MSLKTDNILLPHGEAFAAGVACLFPIEVLGLIQVAFNERLLDIAAAQQLVDSSESFLVLRVIEVPNDDRKFWTNLRLEAYHAHVCYSLLLFAQ